MDKVLPYLIALLLLIAIGLLIVLVLKKDKSKNTADLLPFQTNNYENVQLINEQLNKQKEELNTLLNAQLLAINNQNHSNFKENQETFSANILQIQKTISELTKKQEEISSNNNEKIQKELGEVKDNLSKFLNEQITNLNKDVGVKLSENFKVNLDQLEKVTEKLTKLDETKTTMLDLNLEIKKFQEIFTSNQQTGYLGEWKLESLLSSIFGENTLYYEMQSKLSLEDGNVRPDSVVFVDGKKLCIDSKFPLSGFSELLNKESTPELRKTFKENVKSRIKEVAKYSLSEDTIGYSLMFIPSESLFQLLLQSEYEKLIQDAYDAKVIIVSPSTLASVLFSIKFHETNRIKAESAQQAITAVDKFVKKFKKIIEDWNKIVEHSNKLSSLVDDYNKRQIKLIGSFKSIEDRELLGSTDEEEEILC
jgi:DNA anti-recombination protein RmuC